MKKLGILLCMMLVGAFYAQACHFEFTTPGGEKKSCKPGEELVINIKLTLTHRNCKVAAQETKFKFDGIQVTGATDWKQESPGIYTRQVKAKVLNDGKKKIMLSATRTCDKDGGYGVFTLDK